MTYEQQFEISLRYLNSNEAVSDLKADPYWPKWNSPWWHMLLFYEMGGVKDIPESIVSSYVAALNKMPLKIFPIHPGEMPANVDPYRGTPCHCQLGNVYQVLAARGVDVDREIPWIRPWFLRYQMADGGLNCDNHAYLVKDEVPSSMVGTIAAFEAILLFTGRDHTREERQFLRKGADFLIGRQLLHGSATKHNASERESAKKWLQFCFPRFYLYDSLRGLNALVLWSEKMNEAIPLEAVADVVKSIQRRFPDGLIRIERQAYEGTGSLFPSSDNEWKWSSSATFFPLLEKVSEIGQVSPFLSEQWAQTKARLFRHENLRGLMTG